MYQTKNVLFLVLVFTIIGLLIVFLTHQTDSKSNIFVSQDNYVEHIQPWIETIYLDQSLTNISVVKNNFLDFQGSNQSMGEVHIALFLAFDAWERFLLTGDVNNKQQALQHFSLAVDLLPELNLKIATLENILKQQNV